MTTEKPKLAIERPTRTAASKAAAKMVREDSVRLVLELSPRTRQALKVRAAQQAKTIKAYLLSLAAADGVEVQEVTD